MTTTDTLDLVDYDGKKVELKLHEWEDGQVEHGTVASGAPEMIAFKQKGKSSLQLIRKDQIEFIRLAAEAEPELKARRLNVVELHNVKRHLVDRHGYALADINKMSSEAALEFHDSLDHSPLSHFHADPPKQSTEKSEPLENTIFDEADIEGDIEDDLFSD